MRCKSCEYILWNLAARQCPECGTGFKPSDYEFTLNSVQYRCPHCGQPYYGTAANGHLVPKSFTCVSCNNPVNMDDMVLLPTEGLHEDQTQADEMPWLARKKIGFFKALFGTLGRSMGGPAPLIRLTPVTSPITDALYYVTVTQVVINLLSVGVVILFFAGLAIFGRGGGGIGAIAAMLGTMFGVLLGGLVYALIWAGTVHLTLKLSGPTQAGFGRTVHAICYSSGCNILSGVPCLGFYLSIFGYLWWAIAAIFMVRDGQKVSALRASLAVLWLPVLLMAMGVGVFIWAINASQKAAAAANTATAAAARNGPVVTTPPADLSAAVAGTSPSAVAAGLSNFVAAQGRFPSHAMELSSRGGVPLVHFCTAQGGAFGMPDTRLYRLGGVPFDELMQMEPSRQIAIAAAAAVTLTDPAGAHRLGDYVFCLKGLDPPTVLSPGIWAFVVVPHAWSARDALSIGLADGSTRTIAGADFDAALQEQQAERSAAGLPPFADPRTFPKEW